MQPLKYVRILKRHWGVLVGVALAGFLVGFVTAPRGGATVAGVQSDTYLATHTLLQNGKDSTFSLGQIAFFATAGDVPVQVAQKVGGDPGAIAGQVTASANANLGTIEITANDPDPNRAVQLADTFASELLSYLGVVGQQRAEAQRSALQARLDQLSSQIDALNSQPPGIDASLLKAQKDAAVQEYEGVDKELRDLDRSAAASPVFTLQTAVAVPVSAAEVQARIDLANKAASGSSSKSSTSSQAAPPPIPKASGGGSQSPLVRGGIAGFAGLLLAAIGVLVFARLDPRFHTKEEAEEAFGQPVIAELPRLTRRQQRQTDVLSFDEPRGRTAESFRALRASILFLGAGKMNPVGHPAGSVPQPAPGDPDTAKKVILVTSPGPSEGKTTTVSNLAAVLAEAGLSVLVVNCDFRRPRVHEFLGGSPKERKVGETRIPGVRVLNHVIENGEDANPAEVIATQREVTRKARELFDIILLDTAPLLTTNDAAELLPVADIVVMVARAGKTTFEGADRAMETLERFGAPVVGVALVAANESPSRRYYYYYRPDEVPAESSDDVNPLELVNEGARSGASASELAESALADVSGPRDPGSSAG